MLLSGGMQVPRASQAWAADGSLVRVGPLAFDFMNRCGKIDCDPKSLLVRLQREAEDSNQKMKSRD